LKIGVFEETGSVWLKISGTRGIPHAPTILRIGKLSTFHMVQKYGVSFVFSEFMRLTDGRKDISLVANTAMHSMQHGKNTYW